MNNFECEQFLELTLSLGRQYVETGAEIKRVEDSLYRIYKAYGFENIEIYAITSLIVVTIKGPDGTHYTQSVRVTSGGTDLGRLEDINALIRYICTNKPNLVKLSDIINNPKKTKPKKLLKCIGYMLAAGGFAVFFGGDMLDGTAAAVIAIAVYFMDYNFKLRNINNVIYTFIASLVSGIIALIFTHFGFGNNVDKVMIGVIMLLIPGLLLVNSIKEMFNRDIVTGLYRFVEAVFVAVAIAGGFAVSVLHLDGKPTQQASTGKKLTTTVALRMMLDHAKTVDEALKILDGYDLWIPDGDGNYHFYMADATGRYAIVEFVYDKDHQSKIYIDDEYTGEDGKTHFKYPDVLPNTREVIEKRYASNFYVSETMACSDKGPKLSNHGKTRYDMMEFVLKQNSNQLSEEGAMNLLNGVSQAETPGNPTSHTQWSVVYNLSQRKATVCVNRDYKNKFTFYAK